jgi:hypothetical protein
MFGPIDIDSLDFQTRVQIMLISQRTGVSRNQVVTRAVEELYRRVMADAGDEKAIAGDSGRPVIAARRP